MVVSTVEFETVATAVDVLMTNDACVSLNTLSVSEVCIYVELDDVEAKGEYSDSDESKFDVEADEVETVAEKDVKIDGNPIDVEFSTELDGVDTTGNPGDDAGIELMTKELNVEVEPVEDVVNVDVSFVKVEFGVKLFLDDSTLEMTKEGLELELDGYTMDVLRERV